MNLRLFNVVCILVVVYGIGFSLASTRKTSSFQEKNVRFNEAKESLDKERKDDSWLLTMEDKKRNRYATGMKALGRGGKRLFDSKIKCLS